VVLPGCPSHVQPAAGLHVVATRGTVEESPSVEAAAGKLRPDIDLPGAVRWVRRRLQGIRTSLLILLTVLPGRLGTSAQIRDVRKVLQTERCLVSLREVGSVQLSSLPRPLGFRPWRERTIEGERPLQHKTGPDPP
jgi:hypothetical protein